MRTQTQGRGIGRNLLDFVKNRKERLSLNVYQKNSGAVRFYEREGFRIDEAGWSAKHLLSNEKPESSYKYKDIKNPLYRFSLRTVDFQLITSMGSTSLFS